MSMNYVLGNCEDFVNEKSALQALVEALGHILVMSPKGHCELAGQGIEYDWGKPKQNFRRKNKYINFHELILWSMLRSVLSRSTVSKIFPQGAGISARLQGGCRQRARAY